MQVTFVIKPNSKHREEVVTNSDGTLTVYTKQPAVEGKANESAVRLVAKHFGVSKTHVTIIRGHTSRNKTVQITQ